MPGLSQSIVYDVRVCGTVNPWPSFETLYEEIRRRRRRGPISRRRGGDRADHDQRENEGECSACRTTHSVVLRTHVDPPHVSARHGRAMVAVPIRMERAGGLRTPS